MLSISARVGTPSAGAGWAAASALLSAACNARRKASDLLVPQRFASLSQRATVAGSKATVVRMVMVAITKPLYAHNPKNSRGRGQTNPREALRPHVGAAIGAIAKPDDVHFAEALPKTRSGKIMRRLLKEIAGGGDVKGDTTTLEDFGILSRLKMADG